MDIKLIKHQQEFCEAQEHEVLMLAPMASGKTFAQLYDAKEFALKNPDSCQVLMCHNPAVLLQCGYFDTFNEVAELNKMRSEILFKNNARLLVISIPRVDQPEHRALDRILGRKVNIFRIDTSVFDFGPRVYRNHILQIDRPAGIRPKQVKITAVDCLHSFTKRKGLKIIDVASDDQCLHELLFNEHHPDYKKYILGEWEG